MARQLRISARNAKRHVPPAAPRHWMQSWTRHLYAVGQAMVILAGLAAGVRFSSGRGRRPPLTDSLPADPKPIAQGGEPAQIASADPAFVASWIREQRDWDVKISTPESDRHKLLGARTCTVFGRPAAQALYEIAGVPASLVILAADQSGILPDSKGDLAHEFRGHTVLARRHGALTYAAVGRASKEELAQLMPESIG